MNLRHSVQLSLLLSADVTNELNNFSTQVEASHRKRAVQALKYMLEHVLRPGDKLREALQIPLLLRMAMVTLRRIPASLELEDLIKNTHELQPGAPWVVIQPTEKKWRNLLFDGYVKHMIKRHGSLKGKNKRLETEVQQMTTGLAWLGHELERTGEPIFRLLNVQRSSLPSEKDQKRYDHRVQFWKIAIRSMLGFLFATFIAIPVIWVYYKNRGVTFVFGPNGSSVSANIGVIGMLIVGALGGYAYGSVIGRSFDAKRDLSQQHHLKEEIANKTLWKRAIDLWVQTTERIKNSFITERTAFIIATIVGIIVTIFVITLEGFGVVVTQISPPTVVVAVMLGFFAWGITRKLIPADTELPEEPSDNPLKPIEDEARRRMRDLLFNIGLATLFGAIVVGVAVFLVVLQDQPALALNIWSKAIVLGIGLSAIFGLFYLFDPFLRHGGADVIQRRILFRVLKESGVAQPSLYKFLEKARKYRLLRQEGGGYTFIVNNALLHEYFADKYNDLHSQPQQPPAP